MVGPTGVTAWGSTATSLTSARPGKGHLQQPALIAGLDLLKVDRGRQRQLEPKRPLSDLGYVVYTAGVDAGQSALTLDDHGVFVQHDVQFVRIDAGQLDGDVDVGRRLVDVGRRAPARLGDEHAEAPGAPVVGRLPRLAGRQHHGVAIAQSSVAHFPASSYRLSVISLLIADSYPAATAASRPRNSICPSRASTSTVSPSWNSPWSSRIASGWTISF